MRASTFFWVALCDAASTRRSIQSGSDIGVAADAASAPATRRCSRSLRPTTPSSSSLVVMVIDQLPVVNGRMLHPGCSLLIGKGTCRERAAREHATNRFAHPLQRSRGCDHALLPPLSCRGRRLWATGTTTSSSSVKRQLRMHQEGAEQSEQQASPSTSGTADTSCRSRR